MLWVQLAVLLVLASAVVLLLRQWPYPSPVIRWLLPARQRWPERQVRGWLQAGDFHPGFLRFFNRDPERIPPPGDDLLAPADGLVTSADCRDGIRYIVIALSFWDMHVQRSPVAGRVVSVSPSGEAFTDGEGRDFAFLRAKHCPVQTRIVLATELGEVAVRLITSVAARRIETWCAAGQQVARGQRIGRILLGSTVVLEVPSSMSSQVAIGERVQAGVTAIVARRSTHV